MYNKNNKNRSLQQYAEIRRNTQKYAETPKQRHQAKTPSKDFLRIGFQRLQKHAGGYEQRPSKSKRTLCLRKVKLKDDFN